MAKFHVILAGMSLVVAGSAMAEEPVFQNHLQDATIVSPAQDYQITDLRTDFALNYSSMDGKIADDKSTYQGTDVFASAIYDVKAIGGLRAGLTADYGSFTSGETVSLQPNQANQKSTYDIARTVVSPQVAYPIGPVVLGAAYDLTQIQWRPNTLPSGQNVVAEQSSYGTFRPGVLFASQKMEAGVTYTSPTHITPTKDTQLFVEDPAQVILHGRYALASNFALGGIIANVDDSGLDKDHYKDQQQVKATGEYILSGVKMEGDVGYNTAFYKNKTDMTQATAMTGMAPIATYTVGAAADYGVTKTAKVGGSVGYDFGSDKTGDTKVTASNLVVAVRGNMAF